MEREGGIGLRVKGIEVLVVFWIIICILELEMGLKISFEVIGFVILRKLFDVFGFLFFY